jgi:hypothetical protein
MEINGNYVRPQSSHISIAQTCLTYLLHPAFYKISKKQSEIENTLSTYPLLEHASLYWVHHVSNAEPSQHLQSLIRLFFDTPIASAWVDSLLPAVFSRSVLLLPHQPANSFWIAYVFELKQKIVEYFSRQQKAEFDAQISNFLFKFYEEKVNNQSWLHNSKMPSPAQPALNFIEALKLLQGEKSWSTEEVEKLSQLRSTIRDIIRKLWISLLGHTRD